jgi:predicted alpha/beta hydrolase family esterase
MKISNKQKILDGAGGFVDGLFLAAPRMALPFKAKRKVDPADYEKQVDFYIETGFTQTPESFFLFPDTVPDNTIVSETDYGEGRCQVIAFPSGYESRNPIIRDAYRAYTANQTAYLVRWTHNDAGRKTVLCLHGYMLGEPHQAERMFGVKKLFRAGLDVALFITPFHWRRAPEQKSQRGIFLQPDNVPMTCECLGQAMYDLESTLLILQNRDAGPVGLIGASLGGYNTSLYAALSDKAAFAAMIVPAVSFSTPFGPETARLSFVPDAVFQQKINRVWEFHAPYRMTPKLPAEDMLVVASRGDKLCAFEKVKMLCDNWQIKNVRFLTGGHWLVFNNHARGKAWYGFLAQKGFL